MGDAIAHALASTSKRRGADATEAPAGAALPADKWAPSCCDAGMPLATRVVSCPIRVRVGRPANWPTAADPSASASRAQVVYYT